MTAQASEIIVLDEKMYALLTTPLEPFFEKLPWRPEFESWSTGNYRGYVGRWEIFGAKLYLTGLVGTNWVIPAHLTNQLAIDADPYEPQFSGTKTLRLGDLFPAEGPAVPATWFTGLLTVATGPLFVYVHAGFASLYERYRVINVVNGRVRQVRDWEGAAWAKRNDRWWPDDRWLADNLDDPAAEDGNEPLPDWRTESGFLRSHAYEAAQIEALWRPSGATPSGDARRTTWKDQQRRARQWLHLNRKGG